MQTVPPSRLFVRIAGIECQHCIDALTHAIGGVEGVASVRFHGHVAEVGLASPAVGSPGGLAQPDISGRIISTMGTDPEWLRMAGPTPMEGRRNWLDWDRGGALNGDRPRMAVGTDPNGGAGAKWAGLGSLDGLVGACGADVRWRQGRFDAGMHRKKAQ